MPPGLLTVQQTRDAQAGVTSGLKFRLADSGVEDFYPVTLFHAGYDKVSAFVGLGENREEVRTRGAQGRSGHRCRGRPAARAAARAAADAGGHRAPKAKARAE